MPLLLCHGGPGLWDSFEDLVPLLTDAFQVIRYDQRGCGWSTGQGFSVQQAMQDMEEIRHFWGISRWLVLGHSFGANLALRYGLAHPETMLGLIYLCGTGISGNWHQEYQMERNNRLGPSGLEKLKHLKACWQASDDLEVEKEYSRLLWSTDFSDLEQGFEWSQRLWKPRVQINRQANQELGQDMEKGWSSMDFSQLLCPVWVIHGQKDPRPAWMAETLVHKLPNAQCWLWSDVGHHPWLEDPELVRRFFQEKILPEMC